MANGLASRVTSAEQFAPAHLKDEISALVPQRERLERLNARQLAATGTAGERGRRGLARAASSTLAQNLPARNPRFADALSDATQRQKLRSDITRRGDKSVAQQQLQNRIQLARRGRRREAALTGTLGTAANIRQGVNVGVQDARDFSTASRFDALGGLAGSGLAAFSNTQTGKNLSSQVGGFLKGLF